MRRMLLSCAAGLALLFSSRAGAAAAVKLQLRKTDGVTAYDVSLEKGEAEVTYDPAKAEPKKIAESVSTTGFQASVKAAARSGSLRPAPCASGNTG